MHEWAKLADQKSLEENDHDNLIFLQTEDEIAAIHSIAGAALAGRKSFTATSGPGFSLMQEGIGWAYAIEAPIVIVNSQRQGPSTGMPTMPAQGDILQTQYGSHGDYETIVFYPNSVQECFHYTIHAFNAAQEAQSPVILLIDAFLSHLIESADFSFKRNKNLINIKPFAGIPLTKASKPRYYTGLTSENNIPKTKDPEAFIKWQKKRADKILKAAKNYEFDEYYGSTDAKNLIIAYGITSRLVYDIIDDEPEKYALWRPITLFPFQNEAINKIAHKYDEIYVVEANKGQYHSVVGRKLNQETIAITVAQGGKFLKENILKSIQKSRL